MSNRLGFCFWLVLGLLAGKRVFAQDPEWSQFYAAPLYTNPAFAGTECGRATLNYRNYSNPTDGSAFTFMFAADQHISKLGGGLGFYVLQQSVFNNFRMSEYALSYSFEFPISNNNLSIRWGLQAAYRNYFFNWANLNWSNRLLPLTGFVASEPPAIPSPGLQTSGFANVSSGFLISTSRFYGGMALFNLTQPKITISNNTEAFLMRKITVHSGMVVPVSGNPANPKTSFSPNILVMIQNKYNRVNVGFYLNHGPLVTGIWLRQSEPTGNGLIGLVGLKFDTWKCAYSYDLGSMDKQLTGVHELTAAYLFCLKNEKKFMSRFNCPTF